MGEKVDIQAFDAKNFQLDVAKIALEKDGIIIVRNFYTSAEVAKLNTSLNSEAWLQHAWQVGDNNIWLWNKPGNDVTGVLARSQKLVGIIEQLMGGEVYHYYTARLDLVHQVGDDFLPFHQDYAAWYNYGMLFPKCLSANICINPFDETSGPIKNYLGTTRTGRIEHNVIDGKFKADPERVKWISENLNYGLVLMQPGDIAIRHANMLHGSTPVARAQSGKLLLVFYNKADNSPLLKHPHHGYSPIDKVPHEHLLSCTETSLEGKEFLGPGIEDNVKKTLFKCGFH